MFFFNMIFPNFNHNFVENKQNDNIKVEYSKKILKELQKNLGLVFRLVIYLIGINFILLIQNSRQCLEF